MRDERRPGLSAHVRRNRRGARPRRPRSARRPGPRGLDATHARAGEATSALFGIENPWSQGGDVRWHPMVFALALTATALPADISRCGPSPPMPSSTCWESPTASHGRSSTPRSPRGASTRRVSPASWAASTERGPSWRTAVAPRRRLPLAVRRRLHQHARWFRRPDRIGVAGSVRRAGQPLGARGRGSLRVLVNGSAKRFSIGQNFTIDRAVVLGPPAEAHIASMIRETKRAAGDPAGPEPPATP